MKKIYLLIFLVGFTFVNPQVAYSQKKDSKDNAKVIIDIRGIKKYHNLNELKAMSKGELIPLYIERVNILFNVIQYFGISSKSGVTYAELGIPESKENIKALETEKENRLVFLNSNTTFLKGILPYSDTENIIQAILFYEEVLKLVHTISTE